MRTATFGKALGFLTLLGALAALGYAGWRAVPLRADDAPYQYRTARVESGPPLAAVTATGTVNAVATVQVGAAAAGQIKAVYGDFNGEVRRNQVLARIDPAAFELRYARAQADAEAARATLAVAEKGLDAVNAGVARARVLAVEAQREAERRRALADKGFVAPVDAERAEAAHRQAFEEIETAEDRVGVHEAQVESARMTVRQREAALKQARADIDRTYVRAPIDGTIISRNVDAGQSVAPNTQAAPLFTIARDLRDMQVDAPVEQSGIGRLRVDQPATFTVDAFPRRTFEGRVVQIRKAPQVLQDVVAYTVVVSAPNPDLALLPGMTAKVRFGADPREVVLKVPNAALRFRPPGADARRGLADGNVAAERPSLLWKLDQTGAPVPVEVRIGASDGTSTEIAGGDLREGMEIIVGLLSPAPRP